MSILFARHGETDWNIANRLQGTTDIPLNENGKAQARLLCGNLEKGHRNICRIYSSRQKRALETAEAVGSQYHVPVQAIPGLEEMNFGVFEGHTWDEIERLYRDDVRKWESDKRFNRPPEGESYQELLERLFPALDRILEEAGEELKEGKDILVLTHGTVLMCLLSLKNDLDFATSYLTARVENGQAIKLEPEELREMRLKLYPKR